MSSLPVSNNPENPNAIDLEKYEIKYPGVGNLGIISKEILLKIFSVLNEKELRTVMPVSKKFNILANDCVIWKKIYHKHFKYDRPLLRLPCPDKVLRFVFVDPENSGLANPWKESIKTFVSNYICLICDYHILLF